MWVTDYRMVFRPRRRRRASSAITSPRDAMLANAAPSDGGDEDDETLLRRDDIIPLLCIEQVNLEDAPGGGGRSSSGTKCLHIRCKHTLDRKYTFAKPSMMTQVFRLLKSLAFAADVHHSFAYQYRRGVERGDAARGWGNYDAVSDYTRLGEFFFMEAYD